MATFPRQFRWHSPIRGRKPSGWVIVRIRRQSLENIRAAVHASGNVDERANPSIPPPAFGRGTVFREEDFKFSFAIIARLRPFPGPEASFQFCRSERAAFMSIWPIALCV